MRTSVYMKKKAEARNEAIMWQLQVNDEPMSWEEFITLQQYFRQLGRKFGLLTEFRANGIPC